MEYVVTTSNEIKFSVALISTTSPGKAVYLCKKDAGKSAWSTEEKDAMKFTFEEANEMLSQMGLVGALKAVL